MPSRKRSSSGGASLLKEATKTSSGSSQHDGTSKKQHESTQRLLEALFRHCTARTGKSVLHTPSRETFRHLTWATALLERCAQLDGISNSHLCADLVLAKDVESGYTPLHWAIYQGNFLMILLLLRAVEAEEERKTSTGTHTGLIASSLSTRDLVQRPMDLLMQTETTTTTETTRRPRSSSLSSAGPNSTNLMTALMSSVDNDGQTPAELLADLQRSELWACRRSLYQPRVSSVATTTRFFGRRSSFDLEEVEDEQDELDFLSRGMRFLQRQQQSSSSMAASNPRRCRNTEQTTYGCEVLTFGRAHHCALGVVASKAVSKDGDRASRKVRPQRVQAFAQQDCGSVGGAVAVAGATHHTLVVTSAGHLYAFGLGKGGRLGVGSEAPCSLPTRVRGPLLQHRVVAVAAAENHSLCVCEGSGSVYAWGSNRFGQLGTNTTGDDSGSPSRCCVPRRVDDLKSVLCVSVAAGERHSVALSDQGEVYVWGDNTAGQLGTTRRNGTHKVQRVDYLWNNPSAKVAISISASSQTTLVLTAPARTGTIVNSVYAWGHGSHVPSRVPLESRVNPVAIACARFHNVAISADGKVFTWGLHADALGTGTTGGAQAKGGSNAFSAPQLVSGMLPENGGGIAVAVAASENHTAVVTDAGALLTWGATHGTNILGHEGVRWQPDPKRVPGVHRAVGVAAAKEHTILLMGTSFPAIPPAPNTLQNLAARQVAQHVDLFNVLPIAIMAERLQNDLLGEYCDEFIRKNLDGVLNVCQKSVLNQCLTERLSTATLEWDEYRDEAYHPLLLKAIVPDSGSCERVRLDVLSQAKAMEWIEACNVSYESDCAHELIQRFQKLAVRHTDEIETADEYNNNRRRSKSISFQDEKDMMLDLEKDLATPEGAEARLSSLSKEIRALRKRLGQIAKLERETTLLPEERDKISRKTQLETELGMLEPALEKTRKRVAQYEKEKRAKQVPCCDNKDGVEIDKPRPEDPGKKASAAGSLRCEICKVTCSDEKNLELHMNGRRHRNKLAQVAEEEQRQAAKEMMEAQQRQQVQANLKPSRLPPQTKTSSAWSAKKPKNRPPFNLPPPPHPVPSSITSPVSSRNVREDVVRDMKKSPVTLSSKLSSGSAPSPSLRDIMAEESRTSLPSQKYTPGEKGSGQKLIYPAGSAPLTKSPPWASAPVRSVQIASVLTPATRSPASALLSTKTGYSLGDFIATPSKAKPSKPLPGTWASPKVASPVAASPAPAPVVNFREIQQQEKDFVAKKDQSFGDNGSWFIERRERAGSFREIEAMDAQERDFQMMVEEQLQIEKQIQKELQLQKESKKKASKRGKNPKSNGKRNTPNPVGGAKNKRSPTQDGVNAQGQQSGQKKSGQGRKNTQKNNTKRKAGGRKHAVSGADSTSTSPAQPARTINAEKLLHADDK